MGPRNNDFVREVLRRATALKVDPMPRPSNWTRVQNIEWLERNPITCEEDVTFLTSEVLRVREKLLRKNQEILEQQQNAILVEVVLVEEATGAVVYPTCGSYCV